MRILHTSDWHFGKTAPVIGNYSEEQLFFIEQLETIIREERIDAVLCAGDVYDSANVGADAIALYNSAATKICLNLNRPMVIIAGNHDSAERLSACNELLEQAKLYVRGRISNPVKPILLDGGKTAIYALPFFQPSEVAGLWPEAGIRTMADAVKTVLDSIRAEWDPDRCNIVMAHMSVIGSELSDSDRSAAGAGDSSGYVIGGSASVSPELFDGFDYIALGHIHKPQKLTVNMHYSGTPIAYSFGKEEKQQKGVVIFDTETKKSEFYPLRRIHERKSIVCTYNEAIAYTDLKDTYLNLTLTDRMAGPELFHEMTECFPLLMEFHGQSALSADNSGIRLTASEALNPQPKDIIEHFMKDIWGVEDISTDNDLIELFIQELDNAEKEEIK